MLRRPFPALVLSIAVAVLVGCASTGRIQQQLELQMQAGNYGAALALVEQQRNGALGGKNRLLYYLERGMLLHLDGQYAESNAAFEEAKRIGQALYTKSLSSEGISLMTNDYALDYAGENFERTLIHLFAAMNYSQLGDSDAALVEARQVGEYLRKLQIDTTNENVYQEDAFARYLAALLYESAGEYDAALVAYKKAIAAYGEYGRTFSVGMPGSLFPNAERVAGRLGRWAREDLADLGSPGVAREIPSGSGELVILHYNGLSPVKSQTRITVPFVEAWPLVLALQASADDEARQQIGQATTFVGSIRGVDVVSVVFPKFVDRSYSIARMEPRVAGAAQTTGPELVEDIGAIAEKDLEDRKARIYTKAVARAAIKYAIQKGAEAAAQQADSDYGALLGASAQVVGNIARFASEQADKRVWSSLPDQIWMSSMILPAGAHDVQVDFLSASGGVIETRTIPQVEIAAGGRRFLLLRTVR
jgi:hypothetical protein